MDLLRTAIALGMAALDTYMHWAVRRTALQSGSPALRKLDITLGNLIDSSAKSVEARNLEKKDRPGTRVRNILNERILSEKFQSPKGFESAMAMVGVKKCWTRIAPMMPGTPTPSELQQRLGRIYHDRNMIVHEGDLRRQAEGRPLRTIKQRGKANT